MYMFALTPIIGMSWPALTPLIFATAGALGYKAMMDMKEGGDINEQLRQQLYDTTTIRLRVDDLVLDAMEEEVKRAESLYFQKDDIVVGVIRDERGKLRVEVMGPRGADKKELEAQGRDFAEELAQLFAQNRAVEELERIGAEVVEEMTDENEEVVLKIRRWT